MGLGLGDRPVVVLHPVRFPGLSGELTKGSRTKDFSTMISSLTLNFWFGEF